MIDETPAYSFMKKTLRTISHSFKLYDLKDLYISFNGGKDAQVVLHLVRLALYQFCAADSRSESDAQELFEKRWKSMNIVYFEEAGPLPEVDEFMKEHCSQFNISPITLGKDVKKETHNLVNNYGMKAIFLGTRRGDPYSADLEFYCPSDTDKGWATFMRIHPIIDWTYEQIWRFLRDFKIPYCNLYDKGYTHLGNISNSGPNEFLLQENGEYLPAYKADGKYEHFSRACYEATKKYLDTKHFVIVYKKSMTEILETMKTVNGLFGKNPHISIIEIESLKEFLHILVDQNAALKPQDITVIYIRDKTPLEELKSKVSNFDEFKSFEASPPAHHK